jgi:hypothetical protein
MLNSMSLQKLTTLSEVKCSLILENIAKNIETI